MILTHIYVWAPPAKVPSQGQPMEKIYLKPNRFRTCAVCQNKFSRVLRPSHAQITKFTTLVIINCKFYFILFLNFRGHYTNTNVTTHYNGQIFSIVGTYTWKNISKVDVPDSNATIISTTYVWTVRLWLGVEFKNEHQKHRCPKEIGLETGIVPGNCESSLWPTTTFAYELRFYNLKRQSSWICNC